MSDWRKRCVIDSAENSLQQWHLDARWIPLLIIRLSTGRACRINFHTKVVTFGRRKLCHINSSHDLLHPGGRRNSIWYLARKFTSLGYRELQLIRLMVSKSGIANLCLQSVRNILMEWSIMGRACRTVSLMSNGKGPWRIAPSQLSFQKLMSPRPTI